MARGKRKFLKPAHFAAALQRFYQTRRRARETLRGRDCLVVGSAPDADFSALSPDVALVSVNGSGRRLLDHGRDRIDLTVLDSQVLDPAMNRTKETRAVIVREKVLEKLDIGDVYIVDSTKEPEIGPMAQLATRYRRTTRVGRVERRWIACSATGTTWFDQNSDSLISTGAFAIALCAFAGARSIVFTGFGLYRQAQKGDPHYYASLGIRFNNDPAPAPAAPPSPEADAPVFVRTHAAADCGVVNALFLSGFDIRTTDRDFVALVRNFER